MRAEERDRRAALIARKEAALRRWPNRADEEFKAELNEVVHELDQLARSLDEAQADGLDRLRTWCALGEAYLLLGQKHSLQAASEAFRNAEALSSLVEAHAQELMNLKHGYGCALLELAAGRDMALASEAAARLSGALALARKYMPVGVANIKYELFRAEHTVAQLRGASLRDASLRDADRAREIEEAA
ncbi:MAG TPA: hypothetical protein VF876_05640 [Burkholderiales bacterium]